MKELFKKWTDNSNKAWKNAWDSKNIGSSLSGILGGITQVVGAGAENAEIDNTSAEEAAIENLRNTQFGSGNLDTLLSQFDSNAMSSADYTQNDVRGTTGGQRAVGTLKGIASGAIAGAKVGGPWGALVGGVIGLGSGLIGNAIGNKRVKDKAIALNARAEEANASYLNNFNNSVENTQNTMFNNSLLNIAANGGRIYIKPSKRGTFTAAAKQRGLSVQEFASRVLANPNNYSEAMRKKAQFAKNASKWHSYGGPLYNHAGDFDNGLIFINEGGTHEQNPFEGVMIGIDPEGTPNLVEEGEIIYNDYVFSNRLKPTKKQLEDSGLNKKYDGWTFAKIVEDLQKETADNPIDFIAQNTFEDMMNTVMGMQEDIRMKKNKTDNRFDKGGPKNAYSNTVVRNFINQALKPITIQDDTPLFIRYGEETLPQIESPVVKDVSKPVNTNLSAPVIGSTESDDSVFNWQSLGRYAPVVANSASLLSNIFAKPDYSNANAGLEAMRNVPTVDVTPIGGYQEYNPIDRNYLLNKQLNVGRAASRDIQNQAVTGAQAIAGLTNLNYGIQSGIGDALFQLARENEARKLQTAQFNLGIDQYNANQALQAQQANQQRAFNIAQAAANAGQMREAIDAQRAAAISQGLIGLTTDLAGIGTEAEHKAWLQGLIDSGAIEDYLKGKKKNGGKLLTKKRK